MRSLVHRLLGLPSVGPILLALASASVLATGIAGVGRHNQNGVTDEAYFHAAGACWRQSKNPYNVKTLIKIINGVTNIQAVGFAYPPQGSSLFVPLSFHSPGAARNSWVVE